jgi:hypothetical protein
MAIAPLRPESASRPTLVAIGAEGDSANAASAPNARDKKRAGNLPGPVFLHRCNDAR